MKEDIIKEIQESDSLQVLKLVNSKLIHYLHNHTHILYDLRTILGVDYKVYLEIGSHIGSSACLMLRHPHPTKIICIDPCFNNIHTLLTNNLSRNNIHKHDWVLYDKLSQDPQLLAKLKGECLKVDLLFIDGEHSSEAVSRDFNNYHEFVNKGGFIVFDDYGCAPSVKKAVDGIVAKINKNKYTIIGCLPNIKKAYSKMERVISNLFIVYVNP